MKRRKAIAAVLAAVLSLVSASAAYAKELSEQEMTEQSLLIRIHLRHPSSRLVMMHMISTRS